MTYEEAIKVLHKDRALCMFNPMTGENEPMNEDCRLSAFALDAAIKALEKQIPKKLIATDWYQVHDGIQWKDWKCPTCGHVLWRKELTDEYCKPVTYTMQYHCICGQNIDNS